MNKKFDKKDYLNITILALFVIAIVLILTRGKYIYGSTTDWKDQHYLLAEYFRNMFYSTGKLIPELALNIGGGQNIFNFDEGHFMYCYGLKLVKGTVEVRYWSQESKGW